MSDDDDDAPPDPCADWSEVGAAWRKARHADIPALVDQWTAIGLASILEGREWSDTARAEIERGAVPLLRAYYSGFFLGSLGPKADQADRRLH
jgi:hypothetical protein